MPIYTPGLRTRKNRTKSAKRNVVAVLQLTAMVDMFTVLVVFLLQNYASTNQILPISDHVVLPKATSIEQLTPSFVVVLSREKLSFNGEDIADFSTIKNQQEWMVEPLKEMIMEAIEEKKRSAKINIPSNDNPNAPIKLLPFEKLTLQADENIDFLTIKKIMYTLTEAGIKEINFAVIQIKKYPT